MTKSLQKKCLKAIARTPISTSEPTAHVFWREYLSLAVFARVNAGRLLVRMSQIRKLVDRYCTSIGIPEVQKNPEYEKAPYGIKWANQTVPVFLIPQGNEP